MFALTAPCCAQSQIIEDAPGQVADIRAWAVAVHDKLREVPQECGQRVAPVHHAVVAVVQDVTIQVVLFFEVRGAGLRSRGDRHHGIEGDLFGLRCVLVPAAMRTRVCSPMRATRRPARCCTPCISASRGCRRPPSPLWPKQNS